MASSSNDKTALVEVELKKKRPGCSGMFWRSDPTGTNQLASNNHWPRDGAILRGHKVHAKGEDWLIATHVKQAKSDEWHEAPKGSAMPFEYDGHYYLE